jgi:hypothetical protein
MSLNAGWNSLLVKTSEAGGHWGFVASIANSGDRSGLTLFDDNQIF